MQEKIEKLKQIINDNKELNGFFTLQELLSWNISNNDINFLLDNNIIEKIDDDIYYEVNQFFDFYYYISIIVKNSVFSCEVSSFFYDYNDNGYVQTYFLIVPKEIDKNVIEKLKTKFKKNKFIIKVESKEIYELGIVEIETPFGSKVKSYNKEKTLCDFIKYKKEVEFDAFLQYVENYFSWWKQGEDINSLLEYANKMGLENDVRFIIENWKDLDLLKQYHQLSKTN